MTKRKPPKAPKSGRFSSDPAGAPRARRRGPAPKGAPVWLFGAHAVLAALANPERQCHRLLLTPEASERHGERIRAGSETGPAVAPERAERARIDQVLPAGAVHQGLAVLAAPLMQPALDEILAVCSFRAAAGQRKVIVVLDQVTDPHNVGAILRSAAAFGAAAVVAPARHAAPETGTLAKAASGALEIVPYVAVANLARALEDMKRAGFWSLGLAGEAERTLAEADPGGSLALVLGAEGAGLRRLTREHCDLVARLPTRPPVDSLNVSNAVAVALYDVMSKSK